MTSRTLKAITLFAATAALATAARAATPEEMQCAAIKMRKEARFNVCAERCERHYDRAVADNPEKVERAAQRMEQCETRCQTSYDKTLERVENRPPCTLKPNGEDDPGDSRPGNPMACASRLVGADARQLECLARCEIRLRNHPEFEIEACTEKCDSRHQEKVDRILGRTVCNP
jgi:hypothetical protein